ncbi:von Willebrand factor A domain-containing protein 5B2 isoform X2 [Channa argus]|uniref:von Willebrand factor A domain-containing protein 5B2 isoform X2 n=1 Tax=Channa argus TaxID=215402 RepID=UPI0035202E50
MKREREKGAVFVTRKSSAVASQRKLRVALTVEGCRDWTQRQVIRYCTKQHRGCWYPENMVGLRNRSTWEPLLLKASCIKSCANGCSLGITAHLTYANADTESVEGVFVYPLAEKEVVVGFEAVIAGRLLGVQIQSRGKLKDCCLDCCTGSGLDCHCGNGREWGCCGSSSHDMQCTNDEDLERTTFIVGTGVIGPMDIVTIIISTTLELPTLENGAIRIVYPTLLTPIVTGQMTLSRSENGGKSEETGATSCFGATSGKQDRVLDSGQQCAHTIFTNPAANLAPYELNFQLLVRGACLLAGLESPTHALRADADPSAQSASATYITLAQEHPYDRHIEVILHLSEPHSPLVILERGRLSFSQYEQQISSRRDFIRCTHKDSEPERKLEFLRKRYHKDILSSPVLMLNFCPDLLSEPLELHKVTRELLFLVDRSGSMSGTNIQRVKEAMAVALKSLPSRTLLNIVGFGTTIKPLFTSSKLCTDVTLMQAYEYVQRMRADMRGTNLFGALSWLYQQPMQRSYPRQIFIVTDGSISSVAKVLELVRRNTCSGRCFGLGLGPRACRRLLQGVAKLTGGTTEFLDDEERLQAKLIKSLKKAFEPVLTDVRIDWYLPENMEALLSPSEIPPLYSGNHLIGYCTLYDMTYFKAKKAESQGQGYKGVHRGSTCSVSNDEFSPPPASELMPVVTCIDGTDLEEALREISREISSEFSCARDTDPGTSPGIDLDWSSDVRRRIQDASYIQEQYVLTRCSLSSERSLQTKSHSKTHTSSNSDSAGGAFLPDPNSSGSVLDTGSLPQGLEKMPPPEQRSSLSRWADTAWQQNLSADTPDKPTKKSGHLDGGEESRKRQKALARSTMAARSFSSPQGELEMHRLRRALERVSFDQTLGGRLDESDCETKPQSRRTLSRRSLTDSNGLLFPASPMDWDSFTDPEYLFTAVPPDDPPPGQCRSIIHGLLCGRPVSWEVIVDLGHLWNPEGQETSGAEHYGGGGEEVRGREPWAEIIHQLTARSVIRDFEKMAEKESDNGHGSAKRYRMKAIQTSKHCNIICMYTAFTTTDSNPNKGLQDSMDAENTEMHLEYRQSSGSRRQTAYSVGLGRQRASRDSEEIEDNWNITDRDDTPASPCSLTSWDSSVGGGAYSATSPATTAASCSRSQRSIESKSMESFFGTRFPLGRLRSSISSGKQVPLKSHCLSAETEKQPEAEAPDYLPLVHLQLASGAFLLTEIYSDCVQITLDRLKRASPYSLHRRSLSPPFRCTSPSAPSLSTSAKPVGAPSHHVTFSPSSCSLIKPIVPPFHHTPDDTPLMLEPRLRRRHLSDRDPVSSPPDLPSSEEGSLELPIGLSHSHGQGDSGRGSETDVWEGSSAEPADLQESCLLAQEDLEGSSWATAVALAWLEHRCAGYFMEWELVAAKADFWLRCQELPEGMDLAGLKGAARQLFLLLRHWDENIKLNMLCYNPNNM